MPASEGWYLIGPLLVFALVGLLAAALRWDVERGHDAQPEHMAPLAGPVAPLAGPVAPLAGCGDYGLLSPAALAEDADVAEEVRRTLTLAGIRSTTVQGLDGQIVVLVFAEEAEVARRLAGGSPERQ